MKIVKIALLSIFVLFASFSSQAQDKRLTSTKVADLLARIPANDLQLNNKLMNDMLALGDEGQKLICDQVTAPGTGDDSKARTAIESFSRFLSKAENENGRSSWENLCIGYVTGSAANGVKDFFMKQLQLAGTVKSAEAVKPFLTNKDLCNPALAVITATGGKNAEAILSEALKNSDFPCAAVAMTTLASMNSSLAVKEFIKWSSVTDVNTKASAYNALARSGDPAALPVLSNAAKSLGYKWELTGAVASLLTYAKTIGEKGDIKGMDKICKLVMAKCDDNITIQNKTAALEIYSSFHGIDAMPLILKAASHPDMKYRNAAMRMSLAVKDNSVTTKWLEFYPKAIPAARPEIINMLGLRGDQSALPLVNSALSGNDPAVRTAAASAVVKLNGQKAVPALIKYLSDFTGEEDQTAAKNALMTAAGSKEIPMLIPVLKDGAPETKISAIELLAWNSDNKYFNDVLPYASSDNGKIKAAALKALSDLAGSGDQEKLIALLVANNDPSQIRDLQTAIASAANSNSDPAKRSAVILKAVSFGTSKEKLIPVLASTGGREALATVLKEFENGGPEMRDICFKTLTGWSDYLASSALYEICASGNKTFEGAAFDGYVRQIRNARITDEQKCLLFRKIMPYALGEARKNTVLNELGKLKTYQALYFVANYLDDPATSSAAAKAAMTIALPSVSEKAGLYGSITREILTKVVGKITGQESDYNKEMINKYLANMSSDEGFKPMFNGKDLTGWKGLVENPIARAKMKPAELAKKQIEADKKVPLSWSVQNGCIVFNGTGDNLCSVKDYGDFEMLVDWKITKEGDSGIYLRGSPQIQIWDTSRTEVGAQVGSGGLYNNQKNPSKPPVVADNAVGEWNTFRVIMTGEKVSVWLNGILVVDNVTLENYWDRSIPIFPTGAIELQAHGTNLAFRDIYVREISESEFNLTPEEKAEGFVSLFNGRDLNSWTGNKKAYQAVEGMIVIAPGDDSGGNLYTVNEYSDFIYRFEFQLTPAANNGIGIRTPLTGDAAYVGMEIQVLDDTAPVYANLQPYQYHGSVYGVIPAKRGFQKPVGEWNSEEIRAQGTHITVTLNGTVIVDGDIAGPRDNGTMDHNDHPGLKNSGGHIGFLGHGSEVKFRNIRIKDLSK